MENLDDPYPTVATPLHKEHDACHGLLIPENTHEKLGLYEPFIKKRHPSRLEV